MIRLLPRTPRGTWLLAGAVWLAACCALWWVLPYRPRAAWPTEGPAVVHGFIPGTAVVLTSSPPVSAIMDGWPGDTMRGPLLARDAATGTVREWLHANEDLTLVDPGVDGKHVLIGRVVGGRARLFLHDAADGTVIAELPRGGLEEGEESRDAYTQFAAFRPDGRGIVYADGVGDRRWLRVWDVETREEVAAMLDARPPAAWSPDGRTLAYTTQTPDPTLWTTRLWDLTAGHTRAIEASPIPNRKPVQIRFSPDGQTIVSVLDPNEHPNWQSFGVRIEIVGWNTSSGSESFRLTTSGFVFFNKSPWFIIDHVNDVPWEKSLHRHDLATGGKLDSIPFRDTGNSEWLGLSPDGRRMLGRVWVSNSAFEILDRHVLHGILGEVGNLRPQLWETTSGRPLYPLPMAANPSTDGPITHAWSSDERLLAISGETALTVWEMPPRKPLPWLAAGAVIIALPSFVIARRRVRRLRREAAA